jgi:hypothetical protein
MFIKVLIRFFISVDNLDNRYKKPPASYLNKVQQNAQVHIAELQISQFLPYLEDILGISWVYLWHVWANYIDASLKKDHLSTGMGSSLVS